MDIQLHLLLIILLLIIVVIGYKFSKLNIQLENTKTFKYCSIRTNLRSDITHRQISNRIPATLIRHPATSVSLLQTILKTLLNQGTVLSKYGLRYPIFLSCYHPRLSQ
jgi:hypothetical protein